MKVSVVSFQRKDILLALWSRDRKKFYALNRKNRTIREIPALEAVPPKTFQRCVVVLGRSLYLLKQVELPKLKKAMTDKAIKTNLEAWSPFKSPKHYVLSYPKGDKVVHLIAISRSEDIEDASAYLKSHGIKIDAVLPETFCTGEFFKGKSKVAAAVRSDEGVELLYMDTGLRESQFIPQAKWTADSLDFFIRRLGPAGRELQEIILVGPREWFPEVSSEGLAATLIPSGRDIDTVLLGSDFLASPWIKSLGKNRLIRFTPQDVKSLRLGLVIALSGVLLLGAARFGAGLRKVQILKNELAALKDQSQGLETKMDRIGALQADAAFFHDVIERYPSQLAVLSELQNCFPEETYLQRFSFNKDLIEISGVSGKSAEILSRLNASKFFSDAKFKSAIEKDRDTGKEKFAYELRLKR